MKTKPKVKIRYEGYWVAIDNFGVHCKTKEQAEKAARQMEERAIKEWKKANNEETKRIKNLERLGQNIDWYGELLTEKLNRELKRTRHDTEEVLERKGLIREEIKLVISHLRGFLDGTKKVRWNEGYDRIGSHSVGAREAD